MEVEEVTKNWRHVGKEVSVGVKFEIIASAQNDIPMGRIVERRRGVDS
jgi:hypothetical protein